MKNPAFDAGQSVEPKTAASASAAETTTLKAGGNGHGWSKDRAGENPGRMEVIFRYFRLPSEEVRQFQKACEGLTDEDKNELVAGAAKEMGLMVQQ